MKKLVYEGPKDMIEVAAPGGVTIAFFKDQPQDVADDGLADYLLRDHEGLMKFKEAGKASAKGPGKATLGEGEV